MNRLIEEVCALQRKPASIRNISILAHVDHGKTTLSDSLISSNNIFSPKLAGKMRFLDSRPDEQERCITMKASAISLVYTAEEKYLINLIDSPGHVDFSVDVSAALRLCDGAFLLVDAVEGVCSQTITVLKQSWGEKVRLCLVLNKIDRLVKELGKSPAEAYQQLTRIIEEVNAVIGGLIAERQLSPEAREVEEERHLFSPEKGNVAFTSAYDRWGFTLPQFAAIYSKKMGFNPRALAQALWGEFYYNPKTKKTTKKPYSDRAQPMFVQFILDPLWRLYDLILVQRDTEKLQVILGHLGLAIPAKDLASLTVDPRITLTAVINAWLPLDKALLSMAIRILPSPLEAQREKMQVLNPELEERTPELAAGLVACAAEGPCAAFISKMMTCEDRSRSDTNEILFGLSRIYSGEIRSNSIMHVKVKSRGTVECLITQVYLAMGQHLFPVESVPAGNIACLGGLQDIVVKTATISDLPICPSFTPMLYSGSPLVKVAVEPQQLEDMQQLQKGLDMLDRADPSVEIYFQDNGEHILAVCGEVHLERCIKDLEDTFAKVRINVSAPIVSFRETILGQDYIHTELTPNKKCALTVRALVLPDDLSRWLDSQKDTMRRLYRPGATTNAEVRTVFNEGLLRKIEELAPELTHLAAESLLAFGPKRSGNNMLIFASGRTSILSHWCLQEERSEASEGSDDSTSSRSISENDLLSSLIAGFDIAAQAGPLCNEPLYGVCLIVEEVKFLTADVSGLDQYGSLAGQIVGCMKEACRGCVLGNSPRLVEGVYSCTLQTSQESVGKIYGVIGKRRGKIMEEIPQEGTCTFVCKAVLPVAESFGFSTDIRIATSGSIVPALEFSHWQVIPIDPFYQPTTQEELEMNGDLAPLENLAKAYMNSVRRRKGLATETKRVEHAEKQRTLGRNK